MPPSGALLQALGSWEEQSKDNGKALKWWICRDWLLHSRTLWEPLISTRHSTIKHFGGGFWPFMLCVLPCPWPASHMLAVSSLCQPNQSSQPRGPIYCSMCFVIIQWLLIVIWQLEHIKASFQNPGCESWQISGIKQQKGNYHRCWELIGEKKEVKLGDLLLQVQVFCPNLHTWYCPTNLILQ